MRSPLGLGGCSFVGLVFAASLVGCSAADAAGPPGGGDASVDASPEGAADASGEVADDAARDGGVDAPLDVAVDAQGEAATDAGDCIELTLGRMGSNGAAYGAARFSPQIGAAGWDSFWLAFQGSTGTFDLSASTEHSMSTCTHCVYVEEDVSAVTGLTRGYFARSGTLTLTAIDAPGSFVGSVDDVRLEEADWSAGSTQWVAGGACLHVTHAAFDTHPTLCVPFGATVCGSEQACVVPWLPQSTVTGVCLDVGAAAAGGPCDDPTSTTSTDCVSGYQCTGGALENHMLCRKVCDPYGSGTPACDVADETCDPITYVCSRHDVDSATEGGACALADYSGCAATDGRAAGWCVNGTCAKLCRIVPGDAGTTSPDCSSTQTCADELGAGTFGLCR